MTEVYIWLTKGTEIEKCGEEACLEGRDKGKIDNHFYFRCGSTDEST